MNHHLAELFDRKTISERIAYLVSNPSVLEDLSEMDKTEAVTFIKMRYKGRESVSNLGWEDPKVPTADYRAAKVTGKDLAQTFNTQEAALASIIQEMLMRAYRSEIFQMHKALIPPSNVLRRALGAVRRLLKK
ncbi:hypothetical protein [Shimazuella kribbensis]|uniref:hypothetical protein n=1 Tax=Shimazuella kribbensis TaxID=139808 RepID=UPI00048E10AA|nr:hypothetical protein [Shimazuella kribbensis]